MNNWSQTNSFRYFHVLLAFIRCIALPLSLYPIIVSISVMASRHNIDLAVSVWFGFMWQTLEKNYSIDNCWYRHHGYVHTDKQSSMCAQIGFILLGLRKHCTLSVYQQDKNRKFHKGKRAELGNWKRHGFISIDFINEERKKTLWHTHQLQIVFGKVRVNIWQ